MCVQNTNQAAVGWAAHRHESMEQCVAGLGNSRDQAAPGVTAVSRSSAQSGCGSDPINYKIWTIHLLHLSLPINFVSLPQPLSPLCTLKVTHTSHNTALPQIHSSTLKITSSMNPCCYPPNNKFCTKSLNWITWLLSRSDKPTGL